MIVPVNTSGSVKRSSGSSSSGGINGSSFLPNQRHTQMQSPLQQPIQQPFSSQALQAHAQTEENKTVFLQHNSQQKTSKRGQPDPTRIVPSYIPVQPLQLPLSTTEEIQYYHHKLAVVCYSGAYCYY